MPLASCLVRSAIEPTFRTFKFDTTDLSLLPAPKSEELRAKMVKILCTSLD
ncbi:MAG: hypothetical protein F6J90_13230 [Moorea sp. SIOASIH]|uniref:hypothetical protein n=1 Tax=Moorena sp. SIOASIH TaxID=2607817 RepID=UPI0013BE2A76|nr:hypothetical protein [Moorena sp. SIOASIH]NEO37230.1 hypothetical protein [Moorena sp. SIOASIH]